MNTTQLDELQAKYDILKRKFDAQQIVTHEMIFKASQAKMKKMQRKFAISTLCLFVVMLICACLLLIWKEISIYFFIAFVAANIAFVLYWMLRYRKEFSKNGTVDDLLTSAKNYKSLCNMRSRGRYVIFVVALVLLVWMGMEMSHFSPGSQGGGSLNYSWLTGVFAGLIGGFFMARKQKAKDTAICDEIIQSLSTPGEENK